MPTYANEDPNDSVTVWDTVVCEPVDKDFQMVSQAAVCASFEWNLFPPMLTPMTRPV